MKENCLILNPKKGKTEFIVYSSRKSNQPKPTIEIDHPTIYQPSSYEYLGVTLDNHLNMVDHIRKVQKRIRSRINLLRKIRHKISPSVAESIFTSMISPLFFYCNHAFLSMNKTWMNKFESLLNRAKLVINSTKSRNWPTVNTQRKRKLLLDVFNCLEFISHRYETRNEYLLRIPKVNREAGRKLSHFFGALVFNQLPLQARKEESFVIFKNKLRNIYFD